MTILVRDMLRDVYNVKAVRNIDGEISDQMLANNQKVSSR